MRIAVTYDVNSKEVFQHFGQTQNFLLVDVVDGKIKSEMVITNGGNSHHLLVNYLSDLEVEVLLCGGIGNHAIEFLSSVGIKAYPGLSGDAHEAVESYLKGEVSYNPNVIHNCDCHH